MSELKTYKMIDEKYCTDCVCVIPSEVYLKSEADKTIANRDCEIKKLKDSIDKLLKAKTEQIIHEIMQKTLIYGEGFVRVEDAMKLVAELRHNKYKRCLAMAMWCENGKLIYQYKQRCGDAETEMGLDYLMKRAGWYHKWEKRWLELAEKFKEVK